MRRFPGQIVPGVLYLGDWADAEQHERMDELNIKRSALWLCYLSVDKNVLVWLQCKHTPVAQTIVHCMNMFRPR